MYAQIRRFLLAYGSRLQASGQLERIDDIFFFDYRVLLAILRGERELEDGLRELPWRHAYYQGYRNYQIADEIGAAWLGGKQEALRTLAEEGSHWQGIACSSGCYEGPARVIHRVEDVGRLLPGDVLVTRFTDPGWTTAFLHLGAVVTETGGVLSHAAVIAREYGFPAVLAVPQATALLQDGDLVRVDGTRGVVERLKPVT